MKKIYNDTISYSEDCKVTLGGKEIKGFGSWKLPCNISDVDTLGDKYDKFLKGLRSEGTATFSGHFVSTTKETDDSLKQIFGNYTSYIEDFSEYDHIEYNCGIIINDETYCYIHVGFKRETPETAYFLGLSDKKEGTMYE